MTSKSGADGNVLVVTFCTLHWWSYFALASAGKPFNKMPLYLKSHSNGRKGAISEYDKKQRISKDVICDLYYVINERPVLISWEAEHFFWQKHHLEPDSIYPIHLFQKSPQILC